MRLLSREARDWKSRVVSEAKQVLVCESAGAALGTHRSTGSQGQQSSSFKSDGEAEAQFKDMHESNNAQVQQLATSL